MANAFRLEVIGSKDIRSPIKTISATTFMCIHETLPTTTFNNCIYIFVSGLYVVGVARQNVDAFMAYGVLYRLVEMFKTFFEGKFDEQAIHNNFVLAYELLDGTSCALCVLL